MMNEFIHRLFFEVCWECAIYQNKDILKNRVQDPDVKVICKRRYWSADPFLVEEKNQIFLFSEVLDRNISRGLLGVTILNNNNGRTKIVPSIDFDCHTSYPNVFKYKNIWYMVPETSERRTIELYRSDDFPNQWKLEKILINNIVAVDTTVFTKDGKFFLFIYEPDGKNNTLSIAELDLEEGQIVKKVVVEHYEDRIGRPAGNVFLSNGRMIRPTQYCVNRYGEKIIFKEFDFNTESFDYSEHNILEFSPRNLSVSRAIGVHTYNKYNDLEVIDYCVDRFFLFKPIAIILKKLGIFGYSFAKINS